MWTAQKYFWFEIIFFFTWLKVVKKSEVVQYWVIVLRTPTCTSVSQPVQPAPTADAHGRRPQYRLERHAVGPRQRTERNPRDCTRGVDPAACPPPPLHRSVPVTFLHSLASGVVVLSLDQFILQVSFSGLLHLSLHDQPRTYVNLSHK